MGLKTLGFSTHHGFIPYREIEFESDIPIVYNEVGVKYQNNLTVLGPLRVLGFSFRNKYTISTATPIKISIPIEYAPKLGFDVDYSVCVRYTDAEGQIQVVEYDEKTTILRNGVFTIQDVDKHLSCGNLVITPQGLEIHAQHIGWIGE